MIDEIQERILNGIEKLADANNGHEKAAREHAAAEHAYRQLRATHFTTYATDGVKRTVDHLNAMVDIATDKAMLRVRLAEAERESAWELVKSLKTQISALQSLLNSRRAEAEAVRFGQTAGA